MAGGKRKHGVKPANQIVEYTRERMNEMQKCMLDPVYFIKNYIYIKHPKRGKIKFAMYPYQEEMVRMFQQNRFSITLSARQTGKTETSLSYLLWVAMFHPDQTILIASNKASSAMELIARIQYAYEEVPDWLKPGIDDSNYNKHAVGMDNSSRIIATATSKDSGRGMPLSLVYADELAFIPPNIAQEFYTSLTPTLSTGGAMIISSTPNGDTGLFAEIWRRATMGTTGDDGERWGHVHVPWDAPPRPEGQEKFKSFMIDKLGERKWQQEYECQFISSESTLIDSFILNNIEQQIGTKNIEHEYRNTKFWTEIKRNFIYVIGVDPSTGSGNDYTVIEMFEFPSMKQVMEYRENTIRAPTVYEYLKNLIKYVESLGGVVYFTIENNAVGQGMISLYETDANPMDTVFVSEAKKLGVTTTTGSKIRTALRFKEMVEKRQLTMYSSMLYKECKNYVRRKGSYEAQVGATDDCIAAVLLVIRVIEDMQTFDENAYQMLNTFQAEDKEWVSDEEGYELPMPFLF